MIQHTVVFKLKCQKGSAEEKTFMSAAMKLSNIPGVIDFQCLRQTSKKNNFDYCLSMFFETQTTYEAYNSHPEHTAFVENNWLKYVADFMEIDYEGMD